MGLESIGSFLSKAVEWWGKNGETVQSMVSAGKEVANLFGNTNASQTSNGTSAYNTQSAMLMQQQMQSEYRLMYLAYQADMRNTGFQGSFDDWMANGAGGFKVSDKFYNQFNIASGYNQYQ